MTGKTHRAGGMLCSIVSFAVLKQNDLLIPNVNEGLQWLVMYPFCMWGCIASDLDHHWESCPSRDVPSWFVHKALHITEPIEKRLSSGFIYKITHFLNAKHRSWQTHSDLTLVLMFLLLRAILDGKIGYFSAVDRIIASLVVTGICLGVIAHFILDLITPDGICLFGCMLLNNLFNLKLPEKIHLVPRKKYFATGGQWEELINKVLRFLTVIAVAWLLMIIFFPNFKFPYNISFY